MTRRPREQVEVARRDDAPEQFLWRERLWSVREVLGHWVETGAWWNGSRAAALVTGESLREGDGGALAGEPGTAGGAPAYASPALPDEHDREYWRVAAAAGRDAPPGVFELCFDWSYGRWSLERVHD